MSVSDEMILLDQDFRYLIKLKVLSSTKTIKFGMCENRFQSRFLHIFCDITY